MAGKQDRHPDECSECGSRLDQNGFHSDGCSQNGPFKPWPLEDIKLGHLEQKIADRLFQKARRLKWELHNGLDEGYKTIIKISGKPVLVTVWRHWVSRVKNENRYKYRIMFHDLSRSEEPNDASGPVLLETALRAESLFNLIHEPRMRALAREQEKFDKRQKEKNHRMSYLESLKWLAKGL